MVAGHTVVMSTTFTVMDVTPPNGSRSHSGHVHGLHNDGCDTSAKVAGHTVFMSTTFTVVDVTPLHGSRSRSGDVDDLHSDGCDTSKW